MLLDIKDQRVREKIKAAIADLASEPEKQGKPLMGELAGFRSKRVTERYRVIYQVRPDQSIVITAAVGLRKQGDKKDIYSLARKLLRLGL